MAKKRSRNSSQASLNGVADVAISLFDRENLEFLDALRYQRPSASGATPAAPMATEPGSADQIFAEYRISDTDETWGMGELNVKIIHRGRIRIRRNVWPQVITTCSAGLFEDGIRKDFHLNILQHPRFVRMVYVVPV